MKKKHRNIIVDGKEFAWTIKDDVDGDGSNDLKIWFNKKVVYETCIPGHISITPSMIKKKIINNGLDK
jgi:hypothetical protein